VLAQAAVLIRNDGGAEGDGSADAAPQARLVDRTGSPLQVPVASTTRTDAGDEGLRWVVAEGTLAPLAAGDYEIELELAGGASHGFPFSIVP